MTDRTRGVWKAPTNVSLSMVDEPLQVVSDDQLQELNVDVMTGKCINVIRPFPGMGPVVWGARTLTGNRQDWRYVNVRRTLIMIEQSVKLAMQAYVFADHKAETWEAARSTIGSFLHDLWKCGALLGADPSQAYEVLVGLGSTMTPDDILEGMMRIVIKIAINSPEEFMILTFQQRQLKS